jgi:TorA maturation chaperone TorD
MGEQKKFFEAHIGNWAPHLFSDLEKANNAVFYKPVGAIGRLFLEIEQAAFEMT